MKRVNLGFEVEAAKPKRPSRDDDAPRQVPMGAGLNGAQRRKPLTDDKKVRHQMARQQRTAATRRAMAVAFAQRVEAADMLLQTDQYETTQLIYELGFNDALDGNPADPEGVVGYGVPDQYGHPQEDEREWYIKGYTDGMAERGTVPHPLEDRVPELALAASRHEYEGAQMDTSIQREADLLEAMGHATLDEQRRLAADLDALRASRRIAFENDRETEFADEIVADHLTPVAVHALNTTATDWLGEVEDDLPDQAEVQQLAATEASLWWGRTHDAVKADRTELNVQARGWVARWASQYGPYAEVANNAFITHVAHLAKQVVAEGGQTCAVCGAAIERDPANEDPQTWHHADGDKHDHEAKPKSDGDSDKKESARTALRTVADVADLAAFEVEAATDDEFAFEGVAHTADDKPGKVDPEQSGEAESSLPYDHTIADETTPWLAEDWPGGDQPVIDPPMPGAGEGVRQGSTTATDKDKPHAYVSGDPIGGGWGSGPKCKVCGQEPNAQVHMLHHGSQREAAGDASIFCSRCNGSGMVRAGGAVRNCTSCGGSGIKRQVRKKNPDLDAVLPDHTGARNPDGAWKAQVTGSGEMVWSENAVRFDTKEEAEDYANDLLGRWMGADMARVVPADTPNREPVDLNDPTIVVNYRKSSSRQVRGEVPWNAGYNDALARRQARVASRDVGTSDWYYTEGYLAGLDERQAAVGDPKPGVERGVPEEVEKLDDPDNRPMWPWDLEEPGSGASDVANAKNPNDHTSSQRTAASEIEQAIREHAEHLQGTLKPGDRVGNATVTNVGTHTVQYRTDDGWDGSMQIPFLNGQGESLPSHQRALDATSKLDAFRSTIAANLKKGAA